MTAAASLLPRAHKLLLPAPHVGHGGVRLLLGVPSATTRTVAVLREQLIERDRT